MSWIIDNIYNIIFVAIVILITSYGLMTGKVIEWLKWAVSYAESYLGSGTGQLKLREVYNMFIAQFPWFSKIVPFALFSMWVDLALDWMNEQFNKNQNIKNYIVGE